MTAPPKQLPPSSTSVVARSCLPAAPKPKHNLGAALHDALKRMRAAGGVQRTASASKWSQRAECG
eukprot:scaffold904_cov239-Pinguiococcus_pyrenoidosus.AAC.9